nr:retrovirus-related Pol polyprotein from transposon TNT 1-94 [Ipomoea batatas]
MGYGLWAGGGLEIGGRKEKGNRCCSACTCVWWARSTFFVAYAAQVRNSVTFLRYKSVLPFCVRACKFPAFLINRLPSPVIEWESPYQRLYGHAPDLRNLRVFGCLCFASTLSHARHKIAARSRKVQPDLSEASGVDLSENVAQPHSPIPTTVESSHNEPSKGKNPTGAAARLLCFFTVFGRWTNPPFASWRWYKVSTTWSATGSLVRMLADGRNNRTPEGVSSWECGIVKGDKNVLNDLHKKFMHDILVSNINTHKHSVI